MSVLILRINVKPLCYYHPEKVKEEPIGLTTDRKTDRHVKSEMYPILLRRGIYKSTHMPEKTCARSFYCSDDSFGYS